jgi:site-specific recombinase XerD
MTPLRQKMIEYMVLKGFSESTQKSYLAHVRYLAEYFNQSPAHLHEDDVRAYLLHCHVVKHWSYNTCRQFIHAARCLFDKVLHQPLSKDTLPLPVKEHKMPALLSYNEVRRIISCCVNDKHQTALLVAYGTGMRVSEVVNLQIQDLDGERDAIRVRAGKGHKDREVDFTPGLKKCLRTYWRQYEPKTWLFYSRTFRKALAKSTLQRTYTRAKLKAQVHKQGGVHALRHAYATHQLAAGMPLPRLQQLLGHSHISCTLRYTRWLRCTDDTEISTYDLLSPTRKKK